MIKFTSTRQTIAVLFSHLSINGKVFLRYVYSTEGVKTCTLVRYAVDANVIAVKIIQQKELKFINCIKYSKIQYTAKSFLITCIDSATIKQISSDLIMAPSVLFPIDIDKFSV